jgi:hypothetical protein
MRNNVVLDKLRKLGYKIREDCFEYVTFDNGKNTSVFYPCAHNYNDENKYLQDISCPIQISHNILNMDIDREFFIEFYVTT